jgi:hypothetical protein
VRRKLKKRPGSKRWPKKVLVYACWGVPQHRGVDWVHGAHQQRFGKEAARQAEWVKQTYRKRFGIESSYRQMNQGRGWTTSRCPKRRLLLVGLALLLRNVWALLHLVALARRRRGGPQLRPALLTLPALLEWLADALKQHFGTRSVIQVEHAFLL